MSSAAKPAFEPVRKHKLYDQVAHKLEQFILDELEPGDKLPSERELAELCKVSRSSIRDAIRRLELLGLVEPRQGAGTIVREFSTDALAKSLASILVGKRRQVAELLEVRLMLEPAIAARAATNVTPEQLAQMTELISRQGEKAARGELAIEEDSQFHYAIAKAADNSVVLRIVDTLIDLLRGTREQTLQVNRRPEKSYAGHRRILRALEQGDAAAAEAAMRRHLEEITKLVLKLT